MSNRQIGMGLFNPVTGLKVNENELNALGDRLTAVEIEQPSDFYRDGSRTATGNFDMDNHAINNITNTDTDTLTLAGTLVTASGAEFNYLDNTVGSILASKALVPNSGNVLDGNSAATIQGLLLSSGTTSTFATANSTTANTTTLNILGTGSIIAQNNLILTSLNTTPGGAYGGIDFTFTSGPWGRVAFYKSGISQYKVWIDTDALYTHTCKIITGGDVYGRDDNTYNLGLAGYRWLTSYVTTTNTNTIKTISGDLSIDNNIVLTSKTLSGISTLTTTNLAATTMSGTLNMNSNQLSGLARLSCNNTTHALEVYSASGIAVKILTIDTNGLAMSSTAISGVSYLTAITSVSSPLIIDVTDIKMLASTLNIKNSSGTARMTIDSTGIDIIGTGIRNLGPMSFLNSPSYNIISESGSTPYHISHKTQGDLRFFKNNGNLASGTKFKFHNDATEIMSIDETGGIILATKPISGVTSIGCVTVNCSGTSNASTLDTVTLILNGGTVTSSATELNYNDVTTIGVAQASKALIMSATKEIISISNVGTSSVTCPTFNTDASMAFNLPSSANNNFKFSTSNDPSSNFQVYTLKTTGLGQRIQMYVDSDSLYCYNALVSKGFTTFTNITYDLGSSGVKMREVYCQNSLMNTSDQRLKKNIQHTDLGLDFIERLNPVKYQWIVGQNEEVPNEYEYLHSDGGWNDTCEKGREGLEGKYKRNKTVAVRGKRFHYGLIAQDLEQVFKDLDMPAPSMFCYDAIEDAYSIRYDEIISPLISAVQELNAKNRGLEDRLLAIEKRLSL